jgi:hypothetical protein
MLPAGPYIDALTGEEWELYQCGKRCGEEWKVQFRPWKRVVLERGAGQLTEQDAERINALCDEGPVGQAKAKAIMAAAPSHVLVRVPSEDDLRELATQHGKLAEFEAGVDQAIIDGKPLASFSMGGATAETWPKGMGKG